MIILDCHSHNLDSRNAIISVEAQRFEPILGHIYAVGVHPWHADEMRSYERLLAVASHKQVVALGEAGLDRLCKVDFLLQLEIFRRQVELSERIGKPMIIHCVRALDVLLMVRKQLRAQQPWVWHGFRGGVKQLRQLINCGIFPSFGEHFSAESVRELPLEKLLIETDCSSLSIQEIAEKVAAVRNIEPQLFAEVVADNIKNLFRL